MVAVVFAPTAAAFLAQNDDLIVNLLGTLEVEVKSLFREDLASDDPYTWDFGDGTPQRVDGYEVTHTYASPGVKTITVSIDTTEGIKTHSITFTLPGDGQFEADEIEEAEEDEAA
jgi:PKD domain